MSRVLPILFNTEMVRAIMDGRKSCTRRLLKGPFTVHPNGYITKPRGNENLCPYEPPYQLGDIIYVRETWIEECGKYYYRADYDSDYLDPCETLSGGYPASCRNHVMCEGCTATSTRIHWHPSIHMPKEAARIWLKVTDVRVERLQDITADGIRNEGLSSAAVHCGDVEIALKEWENLWNSTIKKSDLDRYGWDANPWVWVIEFERCEKTGEEELCD